MRCFRAGDWPTARDLLADDATYHAPEAPEEYRIDCESPDAIVDLIARFKGKASDVEVVDWTEHGDKVLARLHQPDWASDPDSDWWQDLLRTNRPSEPGRPGRIGRVRGIAPPARPMGL